MGNVSQTVTQILGDILGAPGDTLTLSASTASFKYQEMASAAIACEKAFRIEMEDERIPDLRTVGDWVNYVRERIADRDDGRPAPTDEERESWYYR